jgi:hypothetical protein
MRLVHAPGIWVWNHLAIKFNGSGERTDNGYLRAESELTLYRFRNEQATISQALGDATLPITVIVALADAFASVFLLS